MQFLEIMKKRSLGLIMVYSVINYYNMRMLTRGSKIVSEYDQEIQQSQTADNPVALRGRATQSPRDTSKTN